MVRVTVVEWLVPPPVPVTVIVEVPVLARRFTVMVMVEVPEPGAGIGFGLKPTDTLDGTPLAERLMAELNPPEIVVVMVECPEEPLEIVTDEGDALIVKFGFVPVTVSETVVVCVIPPPVPCTVIV